MNAKNNHLDGFSLVELMVVVAIIGIIATIAVPNFLKFQAKAKQANAKSELSAVYTAHKSFYAFTGEISPNLPYIGYIPDGISLDSNNCPTYASYDSTWPRRFYRVGYGVNNNVNNEFEEVGKISCGVSSSGISNVMIYTENPKNSAVSAYTGGTFEMIEILTFAGDATTCEPILNDTVKTGVCAVGVLNGESLDVWHIDVETKILSNFLNGI